MARTVPVHYLRRNEAEWSPSNVAFFDTETTPVVDGTDEVHLLRLWCASCTRRSKVADEPSRQLDGSGVTGEELADWLEVMLVGQPNLWVWAHNLAFDLTCSRLITLLVHRGWTITDFSVDDRSPWFRLARRSKHMTITDSWSWLPQSLAAIGETVKVKKPDLPAFEDDDAAWLVRCRGDVATLAASILALLDWWDRTRLGRWTITGAATGWNAMRHKLLRNCVLIEPTPEAQVHERKAIRGGRREVWRWGRLSTGPYVQLDIERAHSTIAQHLALPSHRLHPFDTLAPDDVLWRAPSYGAIAECTVTTTAPRYAVRVTGCQWWPVGTFTTVLAWPEIQEARRAGELMAVGPGWRYRLTRHMATWGRWVNDAAAGRDPAVPGVGQIAAKQWGRSVVGKWAGRSSRLVPAGFALNPGWHAEEGWDMAAQARASMVDIAGSRWWVVHDQEPDNAFPAVLAWVESELRVRMGRIVGALTPASLVSCDTDGLIVDLKRLLSSPWADRAGVKRSRSPWVAAQAVCDALAPLVAPLTIRPKNVWRTVTVAGPQHLELTGARHYSGVPASAEPAADGGLVARTWPKLKWQMEHSDGRGYRRPQVTYHLSGNYIAKWCLADGSVAPVQAELAGDGSTVLRPWRTLDPRPAFDLPADGQHPALIRLGPLVTTAAVAVQNLPVVT